MLGSPNPNKKELFTVYLFQHLQALLEFFDTSLVALNLQLVSVHAPDTNADYTKEYRTRRNQHFQNYNSFRRSHSVVINGY